MSTLKKLREQLNKDSSGEVVIEAMILVMIIIYVIFFTFNVAILFYNRMTVVSAATEAASGAGSVFGSAGRDPFVGVVPTTFYKDRPIYRYWNNSISSLSNQTEYKAKWYSSYIMAKNEFANGESKTTSLDNVTVECVQDNYLGATRISVVVEKEYPVLIVNPMKWFGLDPKYNCKGSGSAVCYDVIHQINNMGLYDELTGKLDGAFSITGTLGELEVKAGKATGSTLDAIDGTKTIISKVKEIIEIIKSIFGG